MSVKDVIIEELINQKSLGALIYLIEAGHKLEFTVGDKLYSMCTDNSANYVSLWGEEQEQAFERVDELYEDAVVGGRPFLNVWPSAKIKALH